MAGRRYSESLIFQQDTTGESGNVSQIGYDETLWSALLQPDPTPSEHSQNYEIQYFGICPNDNYINPSFTGPSTNAELPYPVPSSTNKSLLVEYRESGSGGRTECAEDGG